MKVQDKCQFIAYTQVLESFCAYIVTKERPFNQLIWKYIQIYEEGKTLLFWEHGNINHQLTEHPMFWLNLLINSTIRVLLAKYQYLIAVAFVPLSVNQLFKKYLAPLKSICLVFRISVNHQELYFLYLK